MTDSLPDELDRSSYVGPYRFPDNKRRRGPAVLYLATGAALLGAFVARGDAVLVNRGFAIAGGALLAVGAYHLLASTPVTTTATDALAAAAREIAFPVGHASAQLGWRGLRSRPTWRVLLYSGEDPPTKRGLVLVDATDATVVAHFVEPNPEDWAG